MTRRFVDASLTPWAALGAFYLGLLLAAVGWQKSHDLPGFGGWALVWATGVVLIVGVLVGLLTAARRGASASSRTVWLALIASGLGVTAVLVAGELVLRALVQPTRVGPRLLSAPLPPTWPEIRAANLAILDRVAPDMDPWLTFIVPDPELGWSIGAARATADGRYRSSAEGIRSGVQGVVFGNRRPALRIALVGDSYTFGMDGPFEDSWGAQLEELLGPEAQVLNFGVDGYGIDQALLRYRRDVRPWRPDVVLFGFIQHDMVRTTVVYPFLAFGWDYPFAKPRFLLGKDGLQLINTPLPDPRALAMAEAPEALPHVLLDRGYQGIDWRWRRGDPLLLARLFDAALPRWPEQPEVTSRPAMIELSAALLGAFLAEARLEGSDARILYLPSAGAGDFQPPGSPESSIARAMLQRHAIPHLDLTACVAAVPPERRAIPGGNHYTAEANRAVARCLDNELRARERSPEF